MVRQYKENLLSIAALVLAAGSSERMGQPKAFLPYRGSTFIETILTTIREAAVDRAVVAIAQDDPNILKFRALNGISLALNAAHRSVGPISSIAAGIKELFNFPVDSLLVWPVDMPHVAVSTINILMGMADKTRPDIMIPTFQGKRGHPVVFSRSVFGELLEVPVGRGADYVVHRDRGRVVEIPFRTPPSWKTSIRRRITRGLFRQQNRCINSLPGIRFLSL